MQNIASTRKLDSASCPSPSIYLIIRREEIVEGMFERHMCLEDKIVRHKVGSPQVAEDDGEVPESCPFQKSRVLVHYLTFFEAERRTRVGTGDLHEGLVQVVWVVNVTLESHKALERVTKDLGMTKSVSDVVVSLVIRCDHVVLITLVLMELIVHWASSQLLRPLNIVVGHLRSLLSVDLNKTTTNMLRKHESKQEID